MKFSTKAIHTGQKPESTTGAIIPPIYMTSTYVQDEPAHHKGYDYTRAGNPNFTNLETTLAALESGKYATVFSSGLGAGSALMSLLKAGDSVVHTNDLYGGTYRLFNKVFVNFGIRFISVDTQDLPSVEKALRQKPEYLFIETPTNPLLKISDIKKLSDIAHRYNVKVVADNTFASPYFQNPLKLGADFVLHSSTKYLGGHSDVIGGVVVTNDAAAKQKLDFARMAVGLNPSPFDAWLVSRGIKTLHVRMKQHAENAILLAEYLERHPKVKKVYYPGLPTHFNHELACRQMSGFSGIVSVEFNLSLRQSINLISSLKVFSLAESLGGVESLVDHPASMTHASIPRPERMKAGLTDSLIRFSAGIEDSSDIIGDIDKALKKI